MLERPFNRGSARRSHGPAFAARSAGTIVMAAIPAIGLVAIVTTAGAGSVPASSTAPVPPTAAAELGDLPRTVVEVQEAVHRFQRRDYDACVRQLAAAVKSHPELPPPHALFAKLAFLGNQGGLVRPALERAIGEDADHPEVYILFGDLALMEGRLTDGAVHFEKARALAMAKRWTADQRRRFEGLCCQGEAAVAESRGDWKGAGAALSAWLEQEPANARARHRLGRALFGVGRYEPAHAELEKAAGADPTIEPAAVTMAWLYTREHDSGKAREWMEYAVKVAPDSSRVRIAFASWLLEQGRGEEARSQLEAAAGLDPRSIEVRRMLGLAARQRKDLSAAEPIFQSLSEESPGDAWARNQWALVLAEQPDAAKQRRALQLAELSVRQDPKSGEALATLGTVYYRIKRLDDAEKVLRAVVVGGKGNSDAAYMLALVEAERGNPDGAAALVKTALAAPGLFVSRDDARKWLEKRPSKGR